MCPLFYPPADTRLTSTTAVFIFSPRIRQAWRNLIILELYAKLLLVVGSADYIKQGTDMKQIVFEITHLDGSVARHSYDLDLKDKAREFYKKLFKDNLIAGWGIEGK